MGASRTSLLTLAAAATLAAVGSPAAEARGFFGSSFCHRAPFASVARSYVPSSAPRKVAQVKPKTDDVATKRVHQRRPAAEPVKSAGSTDRAAAHTRVAASKASQYRPATAQAKPAAVEGAPTPTPKASDASASSCLTKEYLDTGVVMFRDTCTKEWAVNSTDVATKSSAGRMCLTKDNHQNGVITFKDTCTNEWAMNTQDQVARLPRSQ